MILKGTAKAYRIGLVRVYQVATRPTTLIHPLKDFEQSQRGYGSVQGCELFLKT